VIGGIKSMASTKDRLTRLIAKRLKVAEEKVLPDIRFKEDLKADSMARILLLAAIEDEFKIEITEQEAKILVSPGSVMEYLKARGIKD
jgi:acyl carrier protein